MVMAVQLEMMVSSRRPWQVEACLLPYSNLMQGGFAMVEGDNRMMDKELSLLRYLYARSLFAYILWPTW